MSRCDIAVYGATGFAGSYIVRALATSTLFQKKSIAVAGRNEEKLRQILKEIADETGEKVDDVSKYTIIVADSSKDESLSNMAKQAAVIINAVGPYIIHGDAVLRAAINNGAHHIDLSGEPARTEQKYCKMARDKGVYVVGACGWDSIPCDLGVDFLKRNFDGTLTFAETFVTIRSGESGYTLNSGTYDSIILAIKSIREGNQRALTRSIMPQEMPKAKYRPPRRFPLWKVSENAHTAWSIPFVGSDKSIVDRSQYYDYHVNGKKPVQINTYFSFRSFCISVLFSMWLGIFSFFALFSPTRKILHAHPDGISFGVFKKDGPTKEQIKDTSFDYYFFGTGWGAGEAIDEERPAKKMGAVCHGADPAYVATAACISAAALALIDDKEKLPKEGGVFTTASAFRDTRIYEYLKSLGVTFEII
ncbi:hypothetical protein PFISCL1PPCAC_14716, partial [Pristionchus fissidentatus]